MLRVVTWNILHGGGPTRTAAIALTLREMGADVVVLTEFRGSRGSQIRGVLGDAGLEHQVTTAEGEGDGSVTWGMGTRRTAALAGEPRVERKAVNCVLIASRHPIERVHGVPGGVGRRWLHVTIGGVEVCGVHVPDDSHGASEAKARFWGRILETARAGEGASDRKFMILGDFNTGRRGQDGKHFRCEAMLGRLLSLGYCDAWRRRNPEGREDSWVARGGERGAARIDTAYLSRPLGDALVECGYEHGPREGGLSDHSVLRLTLDVEVRREAKVCAGLFGG